MNYKKGCPVHDAAAKVTGTIRYTDDIRIPGTLHIKLLLSEYAHAFIEHMETQEAEMAPGVHRVLSYKNTPDKSYNSAKRYDYHPVVEDEQIFPRTIRYKGQPVAAVVASTAEEARKALRLIRLTVKEKPAVFDIEKAMGAESPLVHPECSDSNRVGEISIGCGSLDEGFSKAEHIFEDVRETPAIHHLAMEPHAVQAEYLEKRKLIIHTSTQNIFAVRLLLSDLLEIPRHRIRVVKPAMGGAFGSKIPMILEPIAALAAIRTGKPVRLALDRKETFLCTRTRHASKTYIKTGVNSHGKIVAQDIRYLLNAGAYCTQSPNVAAAAAHKAVKLYKIPHFNITGVPIYTNLPVAGAMRGYGSPQLYFAQQSHLYRVARELGIDFIDFQKQNLVDPESLEPVYGFPIGNPRPLDCLSRGAELFSWDHRVRESKFQTKNTSDAETLRGFGMAMGMHGNGVYKAHLDFTGIRIKINEDGSVIFHSGSHDMGNGSITLQKMILSRELKIPMDMIEAVESDTENCPWNLGDFASRGVFISAEAARKSSLEMKELLLEKAALCLSENGEKIQTDGLELIQGGIRNTQTGEILTLEKLLIYIYQTIQITPEISGGHANEADRTSYGAHFAEVEICRRTGKLTLLDYVAVHDVGKVLNPLAIQGQLEGAIQMACGYALCEEMVYDENGNLLNGQLKKYKTIGPERMPKNITLSFIEEGDEPGPYGAKSIGECSVVPGAPAIANAIARALGSYPQRLPVREEWIREQLNEKGLLLPSL